MCSIEEAWGSSQLLNKPKKWSIKTNIIGAENVIKATLENKIQNAVFLSTDKAVYPINAMGLSKAMMEKLVAANSRSSDNGSTLCSTRYGNVMVLREIRL